jgi:hypothetical protein
VLAVLHEARIGLSATTRARQSHGLVVAKRSLPLLQMNGGAIFGIVLLSILFVLIVVYILFQVRALVLLG